jgi:TetR/AcrR family transcriptional regulator, transcriptional repressor of aconitase
MPKVTQSHRDARRTQILDAAMICFARAGFHRTTMQDIVQQAELSPGAIYLYFSSKEEIIVALADERHHSEQKVIAQTCEGNETQTALKLLGQEFLGKLQTSEQRMRRRLGIQIWAEALSSDRLLALMRRGVDEPRKLLSEMIRSAQCRGDFPATLDPDALARIMIALFHGFVLQQAWDEQLSVEPYLATIQAVFQALLQQSSQQETQDRGRGHESENE